MNGAEGTPSDVVRDHVRTVDARIHARLRHPLLLLAVVVGACLTRFVAPRLGWAPDAPLALVSLAAASVAASFIAAFVAFRLAGPHSVAYAIADGIEAIVFCGNNLLFILGVPTPHNFGWLMHFMFVLHSGQSPMRRPLYEALYLGVPVAATLGHAVHGRWVLALTGAILGGVVVMLRRALYRAAEDTAENLGKRAALEAELRSMQVRAERARIARDLHDGVSSELHALIWLMEQKEPPATADRTDLAARLRGAADEIRDVVWGLSMAEKPWADWLADMRARCRELCGDSLRLEFSAEAADATPVGARTQHALTRILLEVTRNAVRHSGGSCLSIRLRREATQVHLEVSDDGRGFVDPTALLSPRGLHNLRTRAAEIGGECEIGDSRAGARVRVALPALPSSAS